MAGELLISDFQNLWIDSPAGVLTNLSPYVLSGNVPAEPDMTNFMTLRTDGGRVSDQNKYGARGGDPSVVFVFDPDLMEILDPLEANTVGGRFQARSGSNATPTAGDRVYYGTNMRLASLVIDWSTGRQPRINTTWTCAIGATSAPTFAVI